MCKRLADSGKPIRCLLWIVVALAAAGCAGKRVASVSEPRVIVIRNSSGVDVTVVTLRNATPAGPGAIRMGSVSPVPRGVSQVFHRPPNPPPIPKAVEVSWADTRGREYKRQLSLESVARTATGMVGETLVIDLRPMGEIVAFVEQQR